MNSHIIKNPLSAEFRKYLMILRKREISFTTFDFSFEFWNFYIAFKKIDIRKQTIEI